MLSDTVQRAILKEGHILGVQLMDEEQRRNFFFRVLSIEETPYPFSFGFLAAGASSGWINPQDEAARTILNPREATLINHFFIGVSPTRAEVYLQYPLDRDKGTLTGTLIVGRGIGVFADGNMSPYRNPSLQTELVSIRDIHPAFNAFTPVPAVVWTYFHAVQYRVSAPLTKLTDEERRRARIFAIFGKTLTTAPNWLSDKGMEV